MNPAPFLAGERVTLHPLEEDDMAFCRDAINQPEVRHNLLMTQPVNIDHEKEWLESIDPEEPVFLIRADGDRVGTIGMDRVHESWGSAIVGYWIHPDYWGNGYCTDALGAVVRYAFDERRLEKLSAEALVTNEGSKRVLEKAGFEQEAVLEKEAYVDGQRVDLARYGLLAEEWR